MSIKYNKFGEVVSVNGIVTGQHLGAPMQDAKPKRPEDNDVYATEMSVQTTIPNSDELLEEQPKPMGGGASSWNDLTDKPFGEEIGEVVLYDAECTKYDQIADGTTWHIEVGKEYTVVFDGVTYSNLVAYINSYGYPTIGADNDFSQYPLSIYEDLLHGGIGYDRPTGDWGDMHSLRITTIGEIVKTIDPKYLPQTGGGGSTGGGYDFVLTYDRDWNIIHHSGLTQNEVDAKLQTEPVNGVLWANMSDIPRQYQFIGISSGNGYIEMYYQPQPSNLNPMMRITWAPDGTFTETELQSK